GEVSDYYFREGRGVSSEELRERFQSVYKAKKSEKEASLKEAGSDRLKDRLAQLKEALDAGLLTEEEFEQKRRDILAAV
ncbi:MAG: SHOCT domain-containing protein, partial [Myxococcales bacterium]|nr:SHOCT domain-containing protein [Myxococcales bacterium]